MAKEKKIKKKQSKKTFFATCGLMVAIVLMPTTALLAIGMLPTLMAGMTTSKGKGSKTLTVGALNLAGCSPFLIELWTKGHRIEYSMDIILNPKTIVIIYSAAAIGYFINWSVTNFITTIMQQTSAQRIKDIKKIKEDLVKRWGEEITGNLKLDVHGFSVEKKGKAEKSDKKKDNTQNEEKEDIKQNSEQGTTRANGER